MFFGNSDILEEDAVQPNVASEVRQVTEKEWRASITKKVFGVVRAYADNLSAQRKGQLFMIDRLDNLCSSQRQLRKLKRAIEQKFCFREKIPNNLFKFPTVGEAVEWAMLFNELEPEISYLFS